MKTKEAQNDSYEDIIGLDYPRPTMRARMPLQERAAQFSPFAALTGFEDYLADTERDTIETLSK